MEKDQITREEWARLTTRLLKELQPTLSNSCYANVRNFVEYVEPAEFDRLRDELFAEARRTGGGAATTAPSLSSSR